MPPPVAFQNTFARLPPRFFARVTPTATPQPALVALNRPLAAELGLDADWLASPAGIDALAGKAVPEGAEPLAAAYAGHQFGNFVPQLGDGRAILLGEVLDRAGARRDIQLKGAGRTPFSRGGDGRAALGPVLREYLVSEAMAALGIFTTRALAAVTTGEPVFRETALPGAVLTRVAASHVRVGSFQFFAARGDTDGLRALADFVINRHYPALAGTPEPYVALLDAVIVRQADLVARWLLVGFIHGVMNTDNTAVSGETIDYGPCAFMDAYDPATVFSSIDQGGRYAYGNQPAIAAWNLARLAEALLPLFGDGDDAAVERANESLARFAPLFNEAYHRGLARKLGLGGGDEDADRSVADGFLALLAAQRTDFTLAFRSLSDAIEPAGERAVRDLFVDPTAFDAWATGWRARLAADGRTAPARKAAMDAVNPLFIPRNHRVEAALEAATERGDFAPFAELGRVLQKPFAQQPDVAAYADPPTAGGPAYRTFCGT